MKELVCKSFMPQVSKTLGILFWSMCICWYNNLILAITFELLALDACISYVHTLCEVFQLYKNIWASYEI